MGLKAPNQRVPKKLLEVLGKGRGEGGCCGLVSGKTLFILNLMFPMLIYGIFFTITSPPFRCPIGADFSNHSSYRFSLVSTEL